MHVSRNEDISIWELLNRVKKTSQGEKLIDRAERVELPHN